MKFSKMGQNFLSLPHQLSNKLVGIRKSTVLIIPFEYGFPDVSLSSFFSRALLHTRWHYQSQAYVVAYINNCNLLQREEGTNF